MIHNFLIILLKSIISYWLLNLFSTFFHAKYKYEGILLYM